MIKKLFKSFIPYLILLVGIFIIVFFLDNYASKISEAPILINISGESDDNDELNNLFILDENASSKKNRLIDADFSFVKAKKLYGEEKYDESHQILLQLELKYPNSESVHNYLGLISLRNQKYYEAQSYFKTAISCDSLYYSAYINYALTSSRLHQYNKAEGNYLKAIEVNSSNPKAYFNLGILYNKTENWDKAKKMLERSIELSSGDEKSKSFTFYGIALLSTYDTLAAIESFNSAIEYKPKSILPRVQLALLNEGIPNQEKELLKILKLNPNSLHVNYYLGELYFNSTNYTKAEYHLRKALKKSTDDENIISKLSSILISQNRLKEAELIVKGFSLYDTLPQSYFHEARIASKKGEANNAIALYKLAIEKSDGEYPEALLNLAILYKKNNNIQEAIKTYQEAINIKNDYVTAYYNLALLFAENKDYEKSIFNYKEAIKYDPKSAKSWYNLASIYEERKENDLAINSLKNAIEADPKYLKALSSLGVLYAKLDNYENAIDTYKELIKHYPNYSRGYYNLALAYTKLGLYSEAIDAYSKVIEINPENIKAKTNIGVLYARMDNFEMAIKTFEDAIDIDVNNHELRYNLALQYEKVGRYNDAIYQASKSIQLKEDYIKAYNKLTELYNLNSDAINANIIQFKKLKIRPNTKELYAVGKNLINNGEYKYSLEALNIVLKENYKMNWTNYWIGMIYMESGDVDESINYFKKVTNLDSKHKFAYYRLGQCYEIKGQTDEANLFYNRLLTLDPEFKIKHKI